MLADSCMVFTLLSTFMRLSWAWLLAGVIVVEQLPRVVLSVSALVGSGPGYALSFRGRTSFNVTATVCIPQSVTSIPAIGAVIPYAACASTAHADWQVAVAVSVTEINAPPEFSIANLNLSSPALPAPGDSLGYALAGVVTDVNVNALWRNITFSVAPGTCTTPTPQSKLSSLPALPFSIVPWSGQLYFTSIVSTTSLFNGWVDPTLACVVASDGGGLSAKLPVVVNYARSVVTLTLSPSVVTVTHYAFGLSNTSVDVFISGTVGVTFNATVSTDSSWLTVAPTSTSKLALFFNSTQMTDFSSSAFSATVLVMLSGTFWVPFPCCIFHL